MLPTEPGAVFQVLVGYGRVWLCSGKADWAKGRYLSCNWDVDELAQLKERIIQDDLLVNCLRTKA
jgi:hypothetical protein